MDSQNRKPKTENRKLNTDSPTMTWDHLQQLRAAARGRIQQGLAELQPQGGNGVVVSGNAISVQGGGGGLPVRRVSWSTYVYATLTQRIYSDWYEIGGPHERQDKPVPVALFVASEEPMWVQSIPGEAMDINVGPEPGLEYWDYKSEFEIRFEALSYPSYSDNGRRLNGEAAYEQRFFRFPVRLEVETFYTLFIEDGPWGEEIVPNKQTVLVGASGATVKVTPTTRVWPHRLRITQAKRL